MLTIKYLYYLFISDTSKLKIFQKFVFLSTHALNFTFPSIMFERTSGLPGTFVTQQNRERDDPVTFYRIGSASMLMQHGASWHDTVFLLNPWLTRE